MVELELYPEKKIKNLYKIGTTNEKKTKIQISQLVKGWLIDNLTHRELSEFVYKRLDHGTAAHNRLITIGLADGTRGIYKDQDIADVISELENSNKEYYSEIICLLKLYYENSNDVENSSNDYFEFKVAEKIIKEKLKATCGIDIGDVEYDGLIVRQISPTDVMSENRPIGKKGEPTHIAVTGTQRNMFPYLMSYGYFTELKCNTNFKSYFVFKAPIFLYYENLKYLFKNLGELNEENIISSQQYENQEKYYDYLRTTLNNYNDEGSKIKTSVSVLRSRKLPGEGKHETEEERYSDRTEDQIELSQKKTDGKEFLFLRRLLFEDDFLILLKHKCEPSYDMFAIKSDDEELSQLTSKYFYAYSSNNKSTAVPPGMFEEPSGETEDDYDSTKLMFETTLKLEKPRNLIYFGAPGTGKSYELNKAKDELLDNYCGDEKEGLYERVTFHPDYSYANFVGAYKPISEKIVTEDGEEKNSVTYDYVPGPFMRLLVKALRNAKEDYPKPFLLIIEEINRSNVSAVFGEVFQLLDRNKEGVSEYSISTSKDMQDYFVKELGGKSEDYSKIKIPNNMFIWATMNSADQGVFPVDTAFKRRWDFEYIELNHEEDENKGYVNIGKKKYLWNDVRNSINDFLIDNGINEDKCMGAFFIKDDNDNNYTEMFRKKVLMYLFEDLRSVRNELFADNTRLYYSKILEDFDDDNIGLEIFNENIWMGLKEVPENDGQNVE